MPVYDFSCRKCDTSVEMHMVIGGELPKCSKCGETLNKVFTPPAIHFKGGGWGGDHVQI